MVDAMTLVSVATAGARDGASGDSGYWWCWALRGCCCSCGLPGHAAVKCPFLPHVKHSPNPLRDALGIFDMLLLVVVEGGGSKSVVESVESDPL